MSGALWRIVNEGQQEICVMFLRFSYSLTRSAMRMKQYMQKGLFYRLSFGCFNYNKQLDRRQVDFLTKWTFFSDRAYIKE